jgi:hypothetical protein
VNGVQGKARPVDKVRVYHDCTGNTLTVWFDDPAKEAICEEVGDDVVLVKDRRGRVIGFERINYLSRKQREQGVTVPVEVQVL